MKYVNQLQYPDLPYPTGCDLEGEAREEGKKTTVKTSGCGLCSAVMIADRLLPNCDFDLKKAMEISFESGANRRFGTNYPKFGPLFAKRYGLTFEMTNDLEKLYECLRTGGVAAANVGGDREGYTGVFSHVGHYIVVMGIEPDGRLAILDPAYEEGIYEEEGRKGKVEVKAGYIALCAPEVLAKEIDNRNPGLFLFHRA